MNEFLAICEQDGKLLDYLKFALNQKASLERKAWYEVFSDFTVGIAMLSNDECNEYFDEYPLHFVYYSRRMLISSDIAYLSDEEYVSLLVKKCMLTLLQCIAVKYGYYD